MTQKDISISDVDDYIREQKKLGKKSIRWGANGKRCFRYLVKATYAGLNWHQPRKIFNGFKFMGVKHYSK
jgi:hypothetical protein